MLSRKVILDRLDELEQQIQALKAALADPIVVGNVRQAVSAWTFIRTRDNLTKKVKEAIAKGENPSAYLQQLAAIDPVFVSQGSPRKQSLLKRLMFQSP